VPNFNWQWEGLKQQFGYNKLPLINAAGSLSELDNACVSAAGDVVLTALKPRQSGDVGDIGDAGSLSLKLPLTLSFLKGK
jgi:hypothetical protein